MTDKAAAWRPTGGQINLSGILFQMLVSLGSGLDATLKVLQADDEGTTVELQPEPFDGGDVEIGSDGRLVIQVKRRAAHFAWSAGEIIRDVLPDLFKAAHGDGEERFHFVTDNDRGCEPFRRFLQWYRSRDRGNKSGSGERFRIGGGNRTVASHDLLATIAKALDAESEADPRLHALLGSLEIVREDEADLDRRIDSLLEVLVEAREDVPHKRQELVGTLVRLGAAGTATTTRLLLERAGLSPQRLVHARRLPRLLRDLLADTFRDFGYEPANDIRQTPHLPTRPVTVFRGESGLGKTWRLCATAAAMANAGRPVLLLRADLGSTELSDRIVAAAWNPTYGSRTPLAVVAERLRPHLQDERGIWLTVFIDDLNDSTLARQLVDQRWDRLGIDMVVSAQPRTAGWLETNSAAPEIVDVPEFTTAQLAAFLDARGVDHAQLKHDVFALLRKPILAKLYSRLPNGAFVRPESEYELMQSFWDYAASHRPELADNPFDVEQLRDVVGKMLAGPFTYPWPSSQLMPPLTADAVRRLASCGLVEVDGARRLSMTHDRLLNWAVASHLANEAADGRLDPAGLAQAVMQAEDLHTTDGVKIGGRLGYVLMDLTWLLLARSGWSADRTASFLLHYLRSGIFDPYNRQFFEQTLPTLGPRAIGLVRALAEQELDEEREHFWPMWLANAMRELGRFAPAEARAAAVAMLRSSEADRVEFGLRVMGSVEAPEVVAELFDTTIRREAAAALAEEHERSELLDAKRRAFDAFARAASATPNWLEARIAAATASNEAEQLLWALVQLPQREGAAIWRQRRDHLFAVIRPGALILPHAVRTFADRADLPRLQLQTPAAADMLYAAATFDALARLDPDDALRILGDPKTDLDQLDTVGTARWWMPGLRYRTRERLAATLLNRARASRDPDAARWLAGLYAGQEELIDDATVDFLLDALEAELTAADRPIQERTQRSWRFLWTLSSLKVLATLAPVAARRGTVLELALAEAAAARPANSSRTVDREGEMMARLLAIMAGDGFDHLVLAQLESTGRTTRQYGLDHALWTTSDEVGDRLERMAAERDAGEDRPYHLMQALASHGRDKGLSRLISARSPVYTNAVDIRTAQSSDTAHLKADIRAGVASGTPAQQLTAVDLAHFLPEDERVALTAPLIREAQPGSDLALKLLMLHLHAGRYEPALLPKLLPLLEPGAKDAPVTALHLALHGDIVGRREAARWLASAGPSDANPQTVNCALALLEHDDSRAGALALLRQLRDRRRSFGRDNAQILEALARHGDTGAADELVTLAYSGDGRDFNAVATAVRSIAKGDAGVAYQAARRLFAASGQQAAARLLIETSAQDGLTELVKAYIAAPLPTRLSIARTLRWSAPRQQMVTALAGMAKAVDSNLRRIAAELAGWMPGRWTLPFLATLVADPVRAVETAALEALHRRASEVAADEILQVAPLQRKPLQWVLLQALAELVDPHLPTHPGDPLDIRPLLKQLPAEFGIEAERLLKRARDKVDKDAEREEKRRG